MMTDKKSSGFLRLVAGFMGLSLTGSVMARAVGARGGNFRLMDDTGASPAVHSFAGAPALGLLQHHTSCPTPVSHPHLTGPTPH